MFKLLIAACLGLLATPVHAQAFKTRTFHADLSAEEQTKFTESPAKGVADLTVDLSTLEVHWTVVFRDLTSEVTAITLNGPAQPGANGVVMLDIGKDDKSSPAEGTAKLNEAQVQFLLNRWAYVNIATRNFPKGEIRGQFTAVRPKAEP